MIMYYYCGKWVKYEKHHVLHPALNLVFPEMIVLSPGISIDESAVQLDFLKSGQVTRQF